MSPGVGTGEGGGAAIGPDKVPFGQLGPLTGERMGDARPPKTVFFFPGLSPIP